MKTIRLAAVALNQTPMSWDSNLANIRAALAEARAQGATAICLPELCLTGYGCEDAFFSAATRARAWNMLQTLLPETRELVVSFGLPVEHQRALYNVAAVAVDGELLGLAAKKNLAGDGIHYEPRWFKPWPQGVVDDFATAEGETIPIGDLLFEIGGVRLGFEICEDAWVADRPGMKLSARGVDVLFNPSASHFAFGKAAVRRRFVAEGSRAFGAAYVYSNLLGNEAGRVIFDGQLLIANGGHLVAESERFGFADFRVLCTTVDVSLGRLAMNRSASHRPTLPSNKDDNRVLDDFTWPAAEPVKTAMNHCHDSKHEEFTQACILGLFDYLRKSRSSGYVVSLSGGADSAAVSCLVRLMFDIGRAELGEQEFARKLGLSTESVEFSQLLLTAYQATENSGETTRQAARLLAEGIGSIHHELSISAIHNTYVQMVEQACGFTLDWQKDDITLQNIQARVRSPGIWMFANLRNAILLATSNRSEAAVGYATMDGDTSGGLAPIAGIDKAYLREWLHWLEHKGPLIKGKPHPIPALTAINAQTPTAELRPSTSAQTDESDLMPYPVLDFIERAAIRDQQSPKEVQQLLASRYPEYSSEQHIQWLKRFFTLWSRNQWKRERYAPSFHLDDENLDPKTWCRWPILSGGFTEELNDLET